MSMFTQRHYVAVAESIRSALEYSSSSEMSEGTWKAAKRLADTFETDSPRFKRDRFLKACEPKAVAEPLARLRHHVTGAIERGEKNAITEESRNAPPATRKS